MDVKFEDHKDEVLSALTQKTELILEVIGELAEGYASSDAPVDTGRLRNDISHSVQADEKSVYIGTNVEYAVYVEYNDYVNHPTGKAHFLRDSVTTHSNEYSDIAKTILSQD